jgi:hypothetical protein
LGKKILEGIMSKKLIVLVLSLCMLCACGKNKVIGIPETTERQPEPAETAVVATNGFMGTGTGFRNGLTIGLVATVVGIGLTWYFTKHFTEKTISRQYNADIEYMLRRANELEQVTRLMIDAGGLVHADPNRIRDVVGYMTQEQDPGKAIEEYQTIVSNFLTAHNYFLRIREINIATLCGEAINTTCLSAIYNPILRNLPDILLLLRNHLQQTCMTTRTTFRPNEQLPWPQVQGPAQ